MVPRSLAALGLALAAACASEPPPARALTSEGYRFLGSGDAATAAMCFDRALTELTREDDGFQRAALGRVEAEAQLDPAGAVELFTELAREAPASRPIGAAEYARVARVLRKSEAPAEARQLVELARRIDPRSRGLAELAGLLDREIATRRREVSIPYCGNCFARRVADD